MELTDDEDIVLLAAYLKVKRNKKHRFHMRREKNRRRRWWVRPTLLKRQDHGQFDQLMNDMRENDREWYFRLEAVSFTWCSNWY